MQPNFLSNQHLPDWKEIEKSMIKRIRDKEKVSSIWKMEDTFCQLFSLMYMYFSIVPGDFQGAHLPLYPKLCNASHYFAAVFHFFAVCESNHVTNGMVYVMKCSKEMLRWQETVDSKRLLR